MFPGFNTEIEAKGGRFHVQTEVMGPREPAILTLVYRAGAIVGRVKRNYQEVLGNHPTEEEVRFLAERQHRRVLTQLGDIPAKEAHSGGTASPDPPGKGGRPPEESLEQIIMDYLNARGGSDPG